MKSLELYPEYNSQIEDFRTALISWGSENFRSFPWRETRNPYHVLLAEIMLHRTQAKQVEPVYLKFISQIPDVLTLYQLPGDSLEEMLGSLGLSWRIELIKRMATELVDRYDGQIPEEKEDLLSLPGVGPYIASAVRCFAFGHEDAIVDINVMRVLTRVFGIPFRDSLRRKKAFIEFANDLMNKENTRAYNFALLDLASEICTPKEPKCPDCPINNLCEYYDENKRK